MTTRTSSIPLQTAVIYLLIAGSWIFFSDRLLALFSTDVATINILQTYKGLFFVILTSTLLFFALRTKLRMVERERIRRTQTENTLHENEAEYSLMIEHSGEAIFLTDQNGTIFSVNPAACKMFGRSREEICTIGRAGIVNANDPRLQLALDERIQTGKLNGELNFIRSDGTIFPGEVSSTVFKDVHGNERTSIIIRDITERKQSEEKLRQLSQAVEQSPVSIVITDTNGTIQYVNQKFVEITGYSLEEAIGKNPRILKSGETSPDEYKKLWQVLTAGEEWHGKFHNRKKNGDLYWESATISLIVNARGETTHYLAVKEDITERKKFEEEIVASRDQLRELALRMEQIREEERTAIAREIHDELGQNLTGLKMNLTWLTKKLNTDEKLRERVFLMRDLVDTTILEVRRIATELRPGILDELGLGAAMAWHGKKFEEGSGIECIIDIDPQIEKISQQCSTAVFRIFQEALTNVGRHSEATLVKTKLSVLNDGLYLEISDNGLGIDNAKLNDRTSIGLLGMKERALALGGEVTITRLPDSGTKITATIPV